MNHKQQQGLQIYNHPNRSENERIFPNRQNLIRKSENEADKVSLAAIFADTQFQIFFNPLEHFKSTRYHLGLHYSKDRYV